MNRNITVEVVINAPIEKVWLFWTDAGHIKKWNFASDDWECPMAENDLRAGGKFKIKMSSKDGSESFDFEGKYLIVEKYKLIEYTLDDERMVKVYFNSTPRGVKIKETFEMEEFNSEDLQRNGWQSILNNFKNYVESEK